MSDDETPMSLEELRERLVQLGILKEGETNAEVDLPRDISASELDYVKKVSALMRQVESLLVVQVEKDKALVQDLHLKVKKSKHGGGL